MASILRSSKFVRYIAGFARSAALSSPREFDGNFINTAHYLCASTSRSFAAQVPIQHEQNLDHSIQRLDQDVRKLGRISRRDIEEVLEELRNARVASSSQSLLVIKCCGSLVPEELPEVRTKLVQEIWSTLNKLNVPMDISHYNALLRVYLDNEHQFSPTDFLAELEARGIEPNQVTYQRLVARYCQVGDIEGATKILQFMKEKQLPVSIAVFNELIVGHSQAGDMDSARGIIGMMTQANLQPTGETYKTLLCGYAKNGDMETMKSIFDECEAKEVDLYGRDYLEVVYALATNGHKEHVPAVLSKVRHSIGYNQDAVNLILRLINKGEDDAAFLVLQSMVPIARADGTPAPTGLFFIKHLVKANRPVSKVVEICNKMEEKGMFEKALLLAAETSLQLGRDKLAYSLLEELRGRDVEIRQHFFWPLILSKADDPTGKEIINVLTQMSKFNIVPNTETLRDYVIPNLRGRSTQILAQLRDANISVGASAACLIHSLLQRNDLEEAAVISGRVNAYYNPDQMRRPLTNAFYKTKDLDSYIAVLRNIYENLERKSVVFDEEQNVPQHVDKVEVVGSFVTDLMSNRHAFPQHIESVLRELIEQGLSISTTAAEKVQERLGEKMTEQISSLLGKLTSGELSPVPLIKNPPAYTPSHQMNIPQLERLIQNLEAKNLDTKGHKRQLLTLYYREKNLEKLEQLLAEIEKQDFVYTPGVYAQLVDIYAYHDDLEKALENFNKLKELQGDDFIIDEMKVVRLALLFMRRGQFDEGIKLLENTPIEKKQGDRNFSYSSLVWRMLNYLADEGRVEDLNAVFDTLVNKDFIQVNNILLGPLIKVHLVNKDLDRALDKFEWCVSRFKATPWKSELASQLIQIDDGAKLQRLTDLSTSVHGEINSLYDLVFSFVECGRVRQARKILETPGLQNRPQRINSACTRYQQEGRVEPLERLKDATRDLNHIDRTDIYYQLLLSYIKQEDANKALGLWTQMQEEDLLPPDQFLLKLGAFLEERGREVPFVMPNRANVETIRDETSVKKSPLQIFRQKVRGGDVDGALELYQKYHSNLTLTDASLLIEKLVQGERLQEATKVALEMLTKNLVPLNRVFRFLLNKLAANGDIESLSMIGSRINQETKKSVSFDNRMCHANLMAGKAEGYLNELEATVDSAQDADLAEIGEKFPRGGAYGIIERHPELVEKYESIAVKYVQKGIVAPLNVLWTYYFIRGNDAKAEEIWGSYLKGSPRIMFQRIVHEARDGKNEDLIKKLIDHLKSSNVTEGAIGNAYSCLLDVLVAQEKDEAAVTAFKSALTDVGLDHINRTAVIRVRGVYEKLGKPFDYEIPPKNAKSLSNNSMSEDEVIKS